MNLPLNKRLLAGLSLAVINLAHADATLLNVSYDVTRELYKDINPAFISAWQGKARETLTINQSHGGSSKQALSVANGLEADVVTMNQATDIDLLVSNKLVGADWRKRLPHHAAPYTTTTVFLVRKGNPKHIKDWDDLTREGIAVIVPNPKTSGNGRYTYLAAWGYAAKKGNDAQAKDFVTRLFGNVPVLDGGGRGATTTFTQRGIGDVLVTFENEAYLVDKEVGGGQFEVVYPSLSIQAEAPVAVVDKVVEKHGTQKQAKAYAEFLFSPVAQDIIARNYLRPRDKKVAKQYQAQFPKIALFTVEDVFGSLDAAQKVHFADGGVYDQIVTNR